MAAWICVTCGVQHADSPQPPPRCVICSDERQYVPEAGQQWTTLAELHTGERRMTVEEIEPGLHEIRVDPTVGIGQRMLLARTDAGNLLWDPCGYLDDDGIDQVRRLGGVAVISASHPHMYGVMIEWSRAFDGVPVYIPEADREWVTRPDPVIRYWRDREQVLPDVQLVRCGGHFPGSATAYWPGADGRGVMLAGDTVMVARDRRWVSFMRSYPNLLPLSGPAVRRIAERLQPFAFDRLYDNFSGVVRCDARSAVVRSAERYADWVAGVHDDLT